MKPFAPFLDRRIPRELLAELLEGGAFAWVTELAREPLDRARPLDLGLRRDPKTNSAHATLYVGTTKVLDVVRTPAGGFRLTPERESGLFAAIKPPFDPAWRQTQPLSAFTPDLPRIRTRVEAAIAAAPDERMKEGFLQAAIARAGDPSFAPVDREVQLAWQTDIVRRDGKARLGEPLAQARATLAEAHSWAKRPKSPGDKIDALALDADGRVLVIEVKPGNQTDTLAWTPVQVGMYLQLINAWITDMPEMAARVLAGMARQRVELGLVHGDVPDPAQPLTAVPVIALGTPVHRPAEAEQRFATVRAAVSAAGVPLDALELWAVDGRTGAVTRTDAKTLDERFAA